MLQSMVSHRVRHDWAAELNWIYYLLNFEIFVVLQLLTLSNSFVIPWNVACQAPLSMGFPWQKYWSWLPFPSPVELPNPGIKPKSPTWQADSLPLRHLGSGLSFTQILRWSVPDFNQILTAWKECNTTRNNLNVKNFIKLQFAFKKDRWCFLAKILKLKL